MATKKARFFAFAAASIDGRIARDPLSGTNWTSKEDWLFFQKKLEQMDAVISGHNTFRVAEKSLRKRNTIVLTSRTRALKTEGKVVFLNPKTEGLPQLIKSRGCKKVGIVGGSKTYDYCLRNGMLDVLYLTIEPYVFTEGVPLFSGRDFKKYKFVLKSVKKLNQRGTLLLKYKYAG